MKPLTEPEIRAAFVNCSKGEAKRAAIPRNLAEQPWEDLDFLGWRDPQSPERAYLSASPQRYDLRVSDELFVPEDFMVPGGLTAGECQLVPLGPQHNESDYAAWTTSIDHIRATPGFAGRNWPHEMSLDDNLGDLERHARDFAGRRGFTYTVLSTGTGDVIGCVYIYPPSGQEAGRHGERPATVSSWVRADHAALDPVLHDAVLAWLEHDWPFDSIEYAPRT